MNDCLRRAAVAVAVASMAISAAACGKAAQSGGVGAGEAGTSGTSTLRIGLLFPDNQTSRWETFDRPLTEKKIKELCHNCTVEYANAKADVATQQQQVDSMITKGVRVMILDAVDSRSMRSSIKKAQEAGVRVVAYDRLAEGPISAYVSFDGGQVGRLQGEALLKALGKKAHGGQIVMMNGPPTDPNSGWFERGALSVLKGRVKIGKAYQTADWKPENANVNMSGAIAALGPEAIDGVYSANDGLASGIISALKAASIAPLPPVTGQDADLAGVQRIVEGEQYMTVYKPFKPEAEAAAEMAVALGRGGTLGGIAQERVSSPTTKDIPAVLLTPVAITVGNIKDTVVKDGVYTIDQICTPKFRPACDRAGLTT